MRVNLAAVRGLLGGWLIAFTLPLLVNPEAIAAWTAAGLEDQGRIGLAAVEMLGAALFAVEATAAAGLALLCVAFIPAAVIHVHHGELPWHLATYVLSGLTLLHLTHRALRSANAA